MISTVHGELFFGQYNYENQPGPIWVPYGMGYPDCNPSASRKQATAWNHMGGSREIWHTGPPWEPSGHGWDWPIAICFLFIYRPIYTIYIIYNRPTNYRISKFWLKLENCARWRIWPWPSIPCRKAILMIHTHAKGQGQRSLNRF